MLGFSSVFSITTDSYYGNVPEDFSFDNLNCTGSESSLSNCKYILNEDCRGGEGAGLRCA
jgi:hypothetical protein